MSIKINFCVACIDKRFDKLLTSYLNTISGNDYYLGTVAGAALPLGYICSCKKLCSSNGCNPCNYDMRLLKDNLIKNIDISKSLDNIKDIYLINHQDCGAMKGYLGCSGYPDNLGDNNQKEIDINTTVLLYAQKYVKCKYPDTDTTLGLLDINGSIANYTNGSWVKVYTGEGTNPLGLWWNY